MIADAEWLSRWEDQRPQTVLFDEDKEIANMNRADYANMLLELEGK